MSDVKADDVEADVHTTEVVKEDAEAASSEIESKTTDEKTENIQENVEATEEEANATKEEAEAGEGAFETQEKKVDIKPSGDNSTKGREHDKRDRKNPNSKDRNGNGYNSKHKRENLSKFDPTVLPVSSDAGKIRAQVEFYFGDSNLPKDNYLWELTDGTSNLPVKIKKIHEFGRLRRFQPYSAVVASLRESTFLEVTGPEGLEEVKRKVPYDPTRSQDLKEARSVYVKGFPEEKPTTQFDIEAFFATYGSTNEVRLRRHADNKLFKGSVFVEYVDEETAQKFLSLEPKPLFQGNELLILSRSDYQAGKNKQIASGEMEPSETKTFHQRNGGRGRGNFRGQNRGRHDRGDRDPDDWKKRRDDDQRSGFKDRRGGGGRGRHDRDHKNRDRANRNGEFSKKREREEDDGDREEASTKKADRKEEPKIETEGS